MEEIPDTLKEKINDMPVGELCDFAMHQYGIELNPGAFTIDGLREEFLKAYTALGAEENRG